MYYHFVKKCMSKTFFRFCVASMIFSNIQTNLRAVGIQDCKQLLIRFKYLNSWTRWPALGTYNVIKHNSRVTFKAQLKVGGNTSTTLNVIYQNNGHSLEFMNLPGTSGHCWSKMASKIAARNKCKGVLYLICCTDIMYFNTSY